MSRIEKRIQKWRNPAFKQNVPKEDLYSVLDYYFEGKWSYGGQRGSHIFKISHPLLKGLPEYGPDGDLTIPVSKGRTVKFFYLRKLIKVIDFITEE